VGIFRAGDAEARAFGFKFSPRSNLAGLVFPYHDPITGNRVTARLRRDKPDIDEDGNPRAKYISPCGDNHHLYFPPDVGDLLANSSVPVALVEAEKSALALLAWARRTGQILMPIATGSCWGWRGKVGAEDENQDKDRRGALPDFNPLNGLGGKPRSFLIRMSQLTRKSKGRVRHWHRSCSDAMPRSTS
jgi:hypothetical protein